MVSHYEINSNHLLAYGNNIEIQNGIYSIPKLHVQNYSNMHFYTYRSCDVHSSKWYKWFNFFCHLWLFSHIFLNCHVLFVLITREIFFFSNEHTKYGPMTGAKNMGQWQVRRIKKKRKQIKRKQNVFNLFKCYW